MADTGVLYIHQVLRFMPLKIGILKPVFTRVTTIFKGLLTGFKAKGYKIESIVAFFTAGNMQERAIAEKYMKGKKQVLRGQN